MCEQCFSFHPGWQVKIIQVWPAVSAHSNKTTGSNSSLLARVISQLYFSNRPRTSSLTPCVCVAS